jgi:hypothetical protein
LLQKARNARKRNPAALASVSARRVLAHALNREGGAEVSLLLPLSSFFQK